MIVKFKKYNESAKVPHKAHKDDFCYDVYAVSEKEIAPNVWEYGLGFALQMERDYEIVETGVYDYDCCACEADKVIDFQHSPLNLSIDIRPRSSVWKTGMVLSNCVGTGDEGYRGEYKAVFFHVMPDMPRYKVGDKILQIKLGMAFPMKIVETEELNQTERGEGGFGSTGK